MVTPEELRAQAMELHEARIRHGDRLPLVDTEIVGEAPMNSNRGPAVFVLMRSTRRRTDRHGRQLPATYFLQGANMAPGGIREACTGALVIPGETLPLVAEMFARGLELELGALSSPTVPGEASKMTTAQQKSDTAGAGTDTKQGDAGEKKSPPTGYFGFEGDPNARGFGLESDPSVGGRFLDVDEVPK